MSSLPDFETFFKALWGEEKPPFPWQTRLATQLGEGRWPDFIDLPTGTGKTSILDIALYRLAVEAHLPPAERKAPVRIVFAVNRRIVVDEAFDRAHEIAKKLKDSLQNTNNKLHPFAIALKNLARDEEANPLEAYPLRGATFTDSSWARTPTQPLILTTTLDQLGSRLLFRGYGVSSGARPIHAALLANDSLLILDEAHTSRAFSQTLAAISQMRNEGSEVLTTPFAFTQLTATPPVNSFQDQELFQLNKDDHDCEIIQRRISVSKPTTLESKSVEKAKGGQRHAKLAKAFSQTLIEDPRFQNCRRTLIVVNRVATAEAVLTELTKAFFKEEERPAIELLTGRIRPLDRDELISRLKDKHQLQSAGRSSPGS
jgi:CRISPR-associated endonuclease/helicase Cas3